jgi:hypothetical protein
MEKQLDKDTITGVQQDSEESDSDKDYTDSGSAITQERSPIKTKSQSQLKAEGKPAPTQISEQIKLALSIDDNGKMLLQSIAGRPPSVASSKRQGLHTVAWAAYESMVANALNGYSPATAFCNIIALSDRLLGQELTNSLTSKGDVDLAAFKKWQDEFYEIKRNDKISNQIRRLALKGKIVEIFPIMEKAIRAILSGQNLKKGVAYAAIGNIDSNVGEGTEIKTAIEALQTLAGDIDKAQRKARQQSIISNIADKAFQLFHYPYVDSQKQISQQQKQDLINSHEYRDLASFRDNDINLLAIQLSNLLGALYENYSKLMGITPAT